jgi:ribosomal 50S subunit-associated protein YjgA (DUF615 family)
MSEPTTGGGQLRTLAVRITEDLRAQLDVVAQITGRSTTEEIRLALEHWVEQTKSDPAILQKAEQIRAEIEREGQTRRNAITAIFGGEVPDPDASEEATPPRSATRRGGKAASE